MYTIYYYRFFFIIIKEQDKYFITHLYENQYKVARLIFPGVASNDLSIFILEHSPPRHSKLVVLRINERLAKASERFV